MQIVFFTDKRNIYYEFFKHAFLFSLTDIYYLSVGKHGFIIKIFDLLKILTLNYGPCPCMHKAWSSVP